ncbi:hypothetical protein [Sphaerothrix gracilis]|uniref:hypothetical protein n=1 Tax=Sphaerothrix gracilis TaxID=3151835 RepID=UPI0031FD9068
MNTDSPVSDSVIDQMIDLRLQLAQLEHKIDTLMPPFFHACAAQELTQFRHKHGIICRRLTPGKWDYPSDILKQEKRLKLLKQQFQQTHEPTAGREVSWSIRLTL